MPTVPNHPIRVNGTPMIAIIGATIGGLAAHHVATTSYPSLALACIAVGVLSHWTTDELLAARRSPHVVYMLHNDQHEVIYVGETEDIDRRIAEHTNGEHDWSNEIYGYTIARHCHSDRQAKRIERRMITVISSCADPGVFGSFCHPLRNEIYDDRHRQAHVRVAVALWKLPYLAASIILNNRCFHTPTTLTRPVPERASAVDDDALSDDADGPGVGEATYTRPHDATDPFRMLALPPSCRNDDRNDQERYATRSPYGGTQPPHPGRYARPVTLDDQGGIGEQIRDAHDRQRAATLHTDPPPPSSRASRRRPAGPPKTNAQRQREWRDRQRAAAVEGNPTRTARVHPPADATPPTPPGGDGGLGEGEDQADAG